MDKIEEIRTMVKSHCNIVNEELVKSIYQMIFDATMETEQRLRLSVEEIYKAIASIWNINNHKK